jgi:hypothetical protein
VTHQVPMESGFVDDDYEDDFEDYDDDFEEDDDESGESSNNDEWIDENVEKKKSIIKETMERNEMVRHF